MHWSVIVHYKCTQMMREREREGKKVTATSLLTTFTFVHCHCFICWFAFSGQIKRKPLALRSSGVQSIALTRTNGTVEQFISMSRQFVQHEFTSHFALCISSLVVVVVVVAAAAVDVSVALVVATACVPALSA